MTRTESNYQLLNEEFKMNQEKLVEAAKTENMLQQTICNYERQLGEQIRSLEKDKDDLQKQVAQLEQDLFGMGEELKIKDQQLKCAKMAIQQVKGGVTSQLENAQKEICSLKDEMNKMLKLQTQLQNEVSAETMIIST